MRKYRFFIAVVALLLTLTSLRTYAKDNTYVVVVGLSEYKDPTMNLPYEYTVASAKEVAKFFHHSIACHPFMLVDKNATKDHIIRTLRSEFSKADEDDIVMFVFSGHGYQGGITTHDFNGTRDYAISYGEIQKIMRQSKAKRKIIIAEACYSGGFNNKGGNGKVERKGNNIQHTNNSQLEVMIYTSSRANEISYVPGFLRYVLEGLAGAADNNSDHKITSRELFNYVNPRVINNTGNAQHPQMWGKFANDMVVGYY